MSHRVDKQLGLARWGRPTRAGNVAAMERNHPLRRDAAQQQR
jgi:hypothetical protein